MSIEEFIRCLHHGLQLESILDVGAGHGGVFDSAYWTQRPMQVRAACDIHSVRGLPEAWVIQTGVNVESLTEHYAKKAFDIVQCTEVIEHVSNPSIALRKMEFVARKIVIVTTTDETQHLGPEQEAIEKYNPNQKYVAMPEKKIFTDAGWEVCASPFNHKHQLIAWKRL